MNYTYEVTLEGEWRRANTFRSDAEMIETSLNLMPYFRKVSVDGTFPLLGSSRNLPRRFDVGDGGTFRLVTDVEAPNSTAALAAAKRRVHRALGSMYLCENPRLTYY